MHNFEPYGNFILFSIEQGLPYDMKHEIANMVFNKMHLEIQKCIFLWETGMFSLGNLPAH